MEAYLFVHFKEKKSPDGEQVYFALSTDGFNWEQVNGGQPVLWSEKGDKGVRDHTIVRTKYGKFYIIATDLSLANHFDGKYKGKWENIVRGGSKYLSLWESDDLLNWSEQRMIELGDEDFGFLWAPEVFHDLMEEDYVIHWTSALASNHFEQKSIYYSRTKDFESFTKPQLLYRKEDSGVIDSALYEENGKYYRFVKSEDNPKGIIMQKGTSLLGEYETVDAFSGEMAKLGSSTYEAPTAYKLSNGKWCLMLDFFGVEGEGQGYVPFVTDDIESGLFIRSDESFSFPYRFKHGTVLSITMEEYSRIKNGY
ncbi:glycoside hydrolase family 43 protein [Paenibacillus sp. Soil750]|uniref:glycoside hydrolase family 43 protein n=1 Tax=Paenibacillus sp. Soil750 TaxID=1736398 RepID=UPI0006F480A5|nr:glycoside hydrolase family 43 protein [Paenibacillus sp. Soil750]KRE69627.1 1,4-beta-xylanase [Paenibacillus sp. Soil750]